MTDGPAEYQITRLLSGTYLDIVQESAHLTGLCC
jgi:hypothetical protein